METIVGILYSKWLIVFFLVCALLTSVLQTTTTPEQALETLRAKKAVFVEKRELVKQLLQELDIKELLK